MLRTQRHNHRYHRELRAPAIAESTDCRALACEEKFQVKKGDRLPPRPRYFRAVVRRLGFTGRPIAACGSCRDSIVVRKEPLTTTLLRIPQRLDPHVTSLRQLTHTHTHTHTHILSVCVLWHIHPWKTDPSILQHLAKDSLMDWLIELLDCCGHVWNWYHCKDYEKIMKRFCTQNMTDLLLLKQ